MSLNYNFIVVCLIYYLYCQSTLPSSSNLNLTEDFQFNTNFTNKIKETVNKTTEAPTNEITQTNNSINDINIEKDERLDLSLNITNITDY